jgi:hypothetical protein
MPPGKHGITNKKPRSERALPIPSGAFFTEHATGYFEVLLVFFTDFLDLLL